MTNIPFHKTLFFTICFVSFLFFSIDSYSQFSYKIEGVVKHNGQPLSGANVLITNSAGTEKELTTNSSGAYSYSLQPNDEYNIAITKGGFTQFQMIYSTMGLSVDLAKKFKGVSKPESELFDAPNDQPTLLKINAILDKPLLSFFYNSEKNIMESDETLDLALTQDLAKVAAMTGGQSSTIETNYKNAIAKGDAAMLKNNYELAKSSYNEAIAAKPTEQYPKTKLADIDKLLAAADAKTKADAAEKERLAKEKATADAAAKEKAEKDKTAAAAAAKDKADRDKAAADIAAKEKADKEKALADAAAKEKAEKDKIAADAAEKDRLAKEAANAEKDKIAKEKALADAAVKEKEMADAAEKARLAKEKADKDKAAADVIEQERLAKEKEKSDAIAKEKADKDKADAAVKEKEVADAAEKARLIKEKADKDKAAADAIEQERLAKEKEKTDAIAKEKAEQEKAAADLVEKDRLAKEAEAKQLQSKYDNALAKGDSAVKVKNYDLAKTAYTDASTLKPKETIPADKIKAVDALIEVEKRSQYTNELAKKYPQGITEEISKEGNVKITKRIVVQGNKGNLYVKKETSFGAVYYFKDDVTISEDEFKKNTESTK